MPGSVSGGGDARYTVAHALVFLLLLAVVVFVPWALISVVQDIRAQENPVYFVTDRAKATGAEHRLFLDLARLNEGDGTITLQATAQRRCLSGCPDTVQLALITVVSPIGDVDEWLPVTQTLTFPPGRDTTSQSVQLPVYGDPIRYPFDQWSFGVLVIPQRVLANGAVEPIPATPGRELLAMSLQSRISRLLMTPDPDRAGAEATAATLLGAPSNRTPPTMAIYVLERPLYLRVLTVLLVLLVTAAAAYAVFLRPLDQLLVNAGALVLGIWGVRAILLGSDSAVLTLVDIALICVILFLLAMITARVLWLVEPRSSLRMLRMPWHRTADAPGPADTASSHDGARSAREEEGPP